MNKERLKALFEKSRCLERQIEELQNEKRLVHLEAAVEICPFGIDQIIPLRNNRRCRVTEVLPGRYGGVDGFQLRVVNVKRDNSDGASKTLVGGYTLDGGTVHRSVWDAEEEEAEAVFREVLGAENA